MIRKYHNHKPQTTLWHREEEQLNHHETPGRQNKQSNQLSLPHQDDCNTRTDTKQRTTKHITITDSHNESNNEQKVNNNRTTALERTAAQATGGLKRILLVPNLRPRKLCFLPVQNTILIIHIVFDDPYIKVRTMIPMLGLLLFGLMHTRQFCHLISIVACGIESINHAPVSLNLLN